MPVTVEIAAAIGEFPAFAAGGGVDGAPKTKGANTTTRVSDSAIRKLGHRFMSTLPSPKFPG